MIPLALPRRAALRWMIALSLWPSAALAEVCDKARPFWDPATGPATAFDEALHLATNPITGVLLVATALAVRFKSVWGGLAAVCGWSAMVGVIAFAGPSAQDSIHQFALKEGCIGSPALFIAVVAAICVATILYTAPNNTRSSNQE